jgi:hypothetical protein
LNNLNKKGDKLWQCLQDLDWMGITEITGRMVSLPILQQEPPTVVMGEMLIVLFGEMIRPRRVAAVHMVVREQMVGMVVMVATAQMEPGAVFKQLRLLFFQGQ